MSNSITANTDFLNFTIGTDSGHRHRPPNLQQKLQEQPDSTIQTISWTGNIKLIIFVSLFLALLAGTIKLFTGYAGAELARAGHTTSTKIHRVIISSDMISLPENMIRYPSQRGMKKVKKLDIYLHWPTLNGYSLELETVFNSVQISKQIIFITLAPRFSELDMSARIGPIYENFFIGSQKQMGYNLVGRQLDPENGFINEYLIIENNSPNPFSARCIKNGDQGGSAYCIRDINIGEGLSLTYRFHSDLIPQWFDLEQSITQKFNAMIL